MNDEDFDLLLMAYAVKAISKKTRDAATSYCGPDNSFPLYADGSHLAAAWDLAGHADDPTAVRECILRFAHEHDLMSHLPLSARQHEIVKKAQDEEEAVKALAREITKLDLDDYVSAPVISDDVTKAWMMPDGRVIIEGWISTEHEDLQHESTPPEAFQSSLSGYMALGGPLTSEHQLLPNGRMMTRYPIGHVQKAALVRDGRIFAEESHPSDPEDFEHFPGTGTGVWGRAVITDALAGSHVQKGNMRGFSFVGRVKQAERLANGGRRLLVVEPWRETTVAAFPVNTKAAVLSVS